MFCDAYNECFVWLMCGGCGFVLDRDSSRAQEVPRRAPAMHRPTSAVRRAVLCFHVPACMHAAFFFVCLLPSVLSCLPWIACSYGILMCS